jgi:hypothetical protein
MRFLPSRQPIHDLSPRPSGYPDKAVVRHEQPSAAAFFEGMKVGARGGLGNLIEHRVRVAEHYLPQRHTPIQFRLEDCALIRKPDPGTWT